MDQEYSQVRSLVTAIREELSTDKKRILIEELEQVPVRRLHFYHRWIQIHTTTFPFACWEDDGYYPVRSNLPRDVQLLMGSMYGKSDIENGGFHQFFTNSTGRLAPEMVEWCERARLNDAANCIKEAMSYFGPIYPRSDELRHVRLNWNPHNENGDFDEGLGCSEWDPFCQLDDCFYEKIFPYKDDSFDQAADHWLKVTCGITRLSSPPA